MIKHYDFHEGIQGEIGYYFNNKNVIVSKVIYRDHVAKI